MCGKCCIGRTGFGTGEVGNLFGIAECLFDRVLMFGLAWFAKVYRDGLNRFIFSLSSRRNSPIG